MLRFASTVAASVGSHIYGRSNSHTGHMCHSDESGHPRYKTSNILRTLSLRPGSSDVVRPPLCGLHNFCSVSFTRIWVCSITLLTNYCCHSYYGLLLTDVNSSFPTVQILGFPGFPLALYRHFTFIFPATFLQPKVGIARNKLIRL